MEDKPSHIPAVGEGQRGEEGHIAYLLRQAHAAVRLGIEHALADLGVTQPQFLIMTLVNAYPGCSSADLARLAMLTPQTISLIVANLERDERLTRQISLTHGRVQQLTLTPSGKELLARCRERTRIIEAQLVAGLSRDDEQIIRRWLVAIAAK
jgi:DNA-binding MarR family transcriptional regulator